MASASGKDHKQDSSEFRCSQVGPPPLLANVVGGSAKPSRVQQRLLGFIRIHASLANMSAIRVIPVKQSAAALHATCEYYSTYSQRGARSGHGRLVSVML
jgi:hypothetical protein